MWLPQGVPLETVGKWVSSYKAAFERHGKPFDADKLMPARGLHVGSDDTRAWQEGGPPYEEFLELARRVAESPDGNASPMPFNAKSMRESAMICGPETCVEKLRAVRELGIEYVIFFSNMGGLDHALVMESMRRFAAFVMPRLRCLRNL